MNKAEMFDQMSIIRGNFDSEKSIPDDHEYWILKRHYHKEEPEPEVDVPVSGVSEINTEFLDK